MTHEVLNQPPPLANYNLFTGDDALREALDRHGAAAFHEDLVGLGQIAGGDEAQEWGRRAQTDLPMLDTHDRYGHRVDEVRYSPAWHELMGVATRYGLHASPWQDSRPAAHVARAAGFIVWSQVEAGHGCPISMTYAAVPALRTDAMIAAAWEPLLSAPGYDPVLRPGKASALAGMAMTEKQGGSDVRANTTLAEKVEDGYLLTGHKWFCSAPMSDLFLTLAQAPGGLTCFALPRILPDGSRNTFRIQRLKDKMGNRSNASAEIEYDGTWAHRLGDEGRGVRTIVEMVSATRLDCVLGSTALMRAALNQAIWHAEHRAAFGALLVDQPSMRSVLADMALEVEASVALGLRLAAAVDATEAARDRSEALLRRIALPAAKYAITKRAQALTGEALECLGGNGYVEDSGMPRLYREAPVNSIWEGSGTINALDLLRALSREQGVLDALLGELGQASGVDPRYDAAVVRLLDAVADPSDLEPRARWLAELVCSLLQASLLLRFSPSAVSDAFIATRLGGEASWTYGTLPRGADTRTILDRARPDA